MTWVVRRWFQGDPASCASDVAHRSCSHLIVGIPTTASSLVEPVLADTPFKLPEASVVRPLPLANRSGLLVPPVLRIISSGIPFGPIVYST